MNANAYDSRKAKMMLTVSRVVVYAILPVILVYLCLSKFIIKGVTAGSVKG